MNQQVLNFLHELPEKCIDIPEHVEVSKCHTFSYVCILYTDLVSLMNVKQNLPIDLFHRSPQMSEGSV